MRSWLVIAVIILAFYTLHKFHSGSRKAHEMTVSEFYQAIRRLGKSSVFMGKLVDYVFCGIEIRNFIGSQ